MDKRNDKIFQKIFATISVMIIIALIVLAAKMFVEGGLDTALLVVVPALGGAGAHWMAREAYDRWEEEEDE